MLINLDWQPLIIDDGVTCMARPMESDGMQKVSSLFRSVQAATEADDNPEVMKKKMATYNPFDNVPALTAVIKEIFPKYLKDLSGIRIKSPDEAEREATIQDLIDKSQLLIVSLTILTKLFQVSTMSIGVKDDLKK